ncbi:MAG: hypothetical protein QOJ69_53 [Actinomycetota bacterium]|nr:hypothetical protein [Actinomycetota bacterium]
MSGWPNQGWREGLAGFGRQLAVQTGDTVDGWRYRANLAVAWWKRMAGAERWNVALYVLTGVSMLALTVEFLAGPDSLPTEVTSAPAAIGSSGLTPVVPVSTTALTLPPATDAPALPQGPPPTVARQPVTPAPAQANPSPPPTAAPADPPPTDPPATQPPQTAPPTSKAPATTIPTGFTVVPPVPPSFPSNIPTGGSGP